MAFSVSKENGYPAVDDLTSGTPQHDAVITTPKKFLSDKDRSIIRQTAWKVGGHVATSYASSVEDWFEKAKALVEKIEQHMKEA